MDVWFWIVVVGAVMALFGALWTLRPVKPSHVYPYPTQEARQRAAESEATTMTALSNALTERDSLRERCDKLRAELDKLQDTKKFMDEWPAVQAEIARQAGADVNAGDSLRFHQEIDSLRNSNTLLLTALDQMRQRKEQAYTERNAVVAALASCYKSGKRKTDIPGWDPEWHNCVYIDLPTGQVSWHYHDSHALLFAHLPRYRRKWDGHTTGVKYERLAEFARDYSV
jgi:hypothetical protein